MIRVDGDTAHVTTVAEVIEMCDVPGIEHVILDNQVEKLKLARIIRHMQDTTPRNQP